MSLTTLETGIEAQSSAGSIRPTCNHNPGVLTPPLKAISTVVSVVRSHRGLSDREDDIGMLALPSSSPLERREDAPVPLDHPAWFALNVRDERIYLAALSYCIFCAGWNDATLGPLLPRMQEYYNINYTVVSILFVTGCLGNITGAVSNIYLSDKLGFGKLITLAATIQLGTYSVMAPAPAFPIMCAAYFFNSMAISFQDAQSTTFIASIPRNGSRNMGILHAIYGLGAFTSPFVATQFSQKPRWSFHFLASLGVAVMNVLVLVTVFRLKKQSDFISEPPAASTDSASLSSARGNKYKQIFAQKSVHLMAFFILFGVGTGVTIGGWIVTYILRQRGGGTSSGYVSSGFYGGVTLGRILLIPVTAKLGNEPAIYVYTILAIALEFTIWFVPSLIGNAVAVAFVGLFLGPFYPVAMSVIAELVPRRLLAGAVGWIAAFGQTGAAVFPFMTGAMASRYGVQVLQPLLVAMMAAQAVFWFFVTHSNARRRD